MKGRSIFILLLLLGIFLSPKSHGQKLKAEAFKLNDSSSVYFDPFFRFPNVNKVPYYYNEKKYKKIKELKEEENWTEYMTGLKDYVSNFGIENFYRDTYLIWELAKVTELYGNIRDAKNYYRLVLKHHRADIDINTIEPHFKEISKKDNPYYVPIEYYYELVDYRREIDTLQPPRGVLLNMGPMVNSNSSDYAPNLSYDNKTLLLSSKRNKKEDFFNQSSNEDLYFSHWNESDGYWDQARPLEGVNSQYNEGSAALSKDGKTLFFVRCNSPDSFGNCDIFTAKLQEDSIWTEVTNLGENVNGTGWDSHPSLSLSEDTLYFASDRIGGFGLSDIYYTYKNSKGEWEKAQNLGPIINTRRNELSPFYHHEYDVFYFSSNGHNLNFGEFDIYKSYYRNGIWTEPKNIGPLVNGPGSEYYFAIDGLSENLYYARSTESNLDNLDLHSFPLPMEAQPLATTSFKGTVEDSETGKPVEGIVSIIDLDNGIEVAPQFLREDGSFEFQLINNSRYLLIIQGDEFFRIEELFKLIGDTTVNKKVEPIHARMEFASIVFGNAEASLKDDMYSDLDKIANFLVDHPNYELVISGHTDSDGNEEFNLELSQNRADAIKEYIISVSNIRNNRIEAIGYGSSKPIVDEQTEEDKQLNRRVEFELIRKDV